jgi:flagellar basal-body rod protein FlgC
MNIDSLMAASRAGLDAEQNKILQANTRIAYANTPLSNTQASAFTKMAGLDANTDTTNTRKAYEPGHPDADGAGFVHYPDVNIVDEMLSLMTSSRAYEANVKSFNTMRSMIAKALDIGGNR